jgi:hypothetical protein
VEYILFTMNGIYAGGYPCVVLRPLVLQLTCSAPILRCSCIYAIETVYPSRHLVHRWRDTGFLVSCLYVISLGIRRLQ